MHTSEVKAIARIARITCTNVRSHIITSCVSMEGLLQHSSISKIFEEETNKKIISTRKEAPFHHSS